MSKEEFIKKFGEELGYICDYADKWGANIYANPEAFRLIFAVKKFSTFRFMPKEPVNEYFDLSYVAYINRNGGSTLVYEGKENG